MVSNTSIFDDDQTDDLFRHASSEAPAMPPQHRSRLAVIASSAIQSAIGPTIVAASLVMFTGADCVAASSAHVHNSVLAVSSTSKEATSARWWHRVREKLEKYRAMPPGWERGAPAISDQSIVAIQAFLELATSPSTPAPAVVPLVDGGIQLEWHVAGVDVEVSATPDGVLNARFGSTDGEDYEQELSADANLEGWVDKLLAVTV
jgi:hypothetical protein